MYYHLVSTLLLQCLVKFECSTYNFSFILDKLQGVRHQFQFRIKFMLDKFIF